MLAPGDAHSRPAFAPAALWPSPWPAEDGGPRRTQAPGPARSGLAIGPGERLVCAASRDAYAGTMAVLRDPGEMYLLRHTLGRRPLETPCEAWVEQIDPVTLEPIAVSPRLPAGPFWPGGLVAHGNGSLITVAGRFCHRLSPTLELRASRELPQPRPYNSLVVLDDGTLAMKDFDRSLAHRARMTMLDPETLAPRCPEFELPEPAIARLSADGDTVYVVGTATVFALRWDGERLTELWRRRYLAQSGQSYGWDPVIEGGHLWLLDNGEHRYSSTMLGAGVAPGPVHLIRISLSDPGDMEAVEVCGAPRGAVTDPPLYDPVRRIAIAYDSAAGVLAAFRFDGRLRPLWQRRLAHAAHMIRFPDTGELVVHDWSGPRGSRTRLAHALGPRLGWVPGIGAVRRAAGRRWGDDVVVLDIETGAERARARVPSLFQSVLFPSPGWGRDLIWCTFSTVARLEVV